MLESLVLAKMSGVVSAKMSFNYLQFQGFANVYEELSRGEKRKTSPTKWDDESPSSKIKSEPLNLQENVFVATDFEKKPIAFENESIRIKSEADFKLDLQNISIPPLPPMMKSEPDFKLDLENLAIPPLPPMMKSEPDFKLDMQNLSVPPLHSMTNLGVNLHPFGSSPSSIVYDFGGINPHKMPEEERTLSNNMGDCCTHLCRICGKSVTVTGMRNHTRTSHGVPINAYTAQFGNYREKLEKVTWHKCGLCAKVFLLDGDEIHKHCNSHRIMMAEYTKMFIVNNYNSTRRGRGSRFPPQNIKLVNMNVNPNANMKTIELGTKTIGTIRIRKESADSKSHADLPSVLNNQALSPGPILPTPPADVFGTINEIENILAKLPDTL